MIPYFTIPPLFGIIHSFGVLVASGILVGARCVKVRSQQLKLDDLAASTVVTWVVLGGFLVSHLFDVLAYRFGEFVADPLILVALKHETYVVPHNVPLVGGCELPLGCGGFSISSFGGFLGAFIGIVWWSRRYHRSLLAYADSVAFGLAAGWTLGRLGCFSAHDHPGHHTDFFLAVRYPDGPRHDLGLDEALFALALTLLFFWLHRKQRRTGTYIALSCLLYAPVRFLFDFLRAEDVHGADPRIFGFTPGQYSALALLAVGLVLAWRVWGRPPDPVPPPSELEHAAEGRAAAPTTPPPATPPTARRGRGAGVKGR